MPVAAIGTLVFAGLLVAALAVYLITIIFILQRIFGTLEGVHSAVRRSADRTAPITSALTDVNSNLTPVADALEKVAEKAEKATTSEPPARVS